MCNKNFNTCSAVSVQVSVQPWVTHCCLHGIMSTINIGVFSPEWGGGGSGVGGGEGWVGGERVGRGGDCWVLWRGLGGGGGRARMVVERVWWRAEGWMGVQRAGRGGKR